MRIAVDFAHCFAIRLHIKIAHCLTMVAAIISLSLPRRAAV